MARKQPLPPSAASLTASLRDLGYSLEAAIADLIDNSISADASVIQIYCDLARDAPVLVIADNGRGMTETEVIGAMRHGSTDPRTPRGPKDLGRFGLGLKTASFSQCKRLTVVSSQGGTMVGAEWNLTEVARDDEWMIAVLDEGEFEALPFIEVLGETGTLVIWRDLDRLFEDETGPKRDEIVNEKLAVVERHLALVFHRFLAGEIKGRRKLAILLNGHPVDPFDPFCRRNAATQLLPEETVWIGETPVTMQPFILPHHSRLSAAEFDFYQDRSEFISNQGAYIYRNGRLMAWGDWFRLVPKGEATKLARVQIDFPNILDEAWTIDIKKSRARPPVAIRERLRQIIDRIAARSVTVHRGRGQKLFQEDAAPLWERYADHTGIRYILNESHPLVTGLALRLPEGSQGGVRLLIQAISAALPVEMIYSDYSTSPREFGPQSYTDEELIERIEQLKSVLFDAEVIDAATLMLVIRSSRLFEGQMDRVEKYLSGDGT